MAVDDSLLDVMTDEEVVQPVRRKPGRPPKAQASTSKSTTAKKPAALASSTAKKAAPAPAKTKKPTKVASRPIEEDFEEEEEDVEMDGEADVGREVTRLRRLIHQLERSTQDLTAERDGYLAERDAYIKQFDELSKLRNTTAEENYKAYRHKAEERAQKQADLVDSLTTALEKVKREKAKLQAAAPLAVPEKVLTKEEKSVQELEKMVRDQARLIKDQKQTIEQRDLELRTEVENSQKLIAAAKSSSNNLAALTKKEPPVSEGSSKVDKHIIGLYEDLTELQVVKVDFVEGQFGQETQYNCIYTTAQRSLNFTIRQSLALEEGSSTPTYQILHYTPKDIAVEPERVDRLGFLRETFTIKWAQVAGFWKEITDRMALVGDDEYEGDESMTQD